MSARRVAILGSTGSIGVNALEVLRRINGTANGGANGNGSYRLYGLSAQKNVALLKKQILAFKPVAAVVSDPRAADALRHWARRAAPGLTVWDGPAGLERLAGRPEVDLLLSSVVGAAGLKPLLAALKAGKTVALANKESLIAAGDLITWTARRHGAQLVPVDSEHSAIFQCLQGAQGGRVALHANGHGAAPVLRRLILTASGGAFYRRPGSLDDVTVKEALKHPTWKMGDKITIDCATLTNKGLEAIEAHYLFGVPMENIEIVIHPQSIVHSLVEFADGAMLAQLSHPDMRIPIQYALTHPARLPTPVRPLKLEEIRSLTFDRPDFRRFPCLALALAVGRRGGAWPAMFSAANEVCVRAFLDGRTTFLGIPRTLAKVMTAFKAHPLSHKPSSKDFTDADAALAEILDADAWARAKAGEIISK